ncbi:MAG: hypothetical protein AAGA31_05710 [Bacteroidota bacterium]
MAIKKKKKLVVLTNGTRTIELSESSFSKSEELYSNEGYRLATEPEVIAHIRGTEEEPKANPKGEAKDKD